MRRALVCGFLFVFSLVGFAQTVTPNLHLTLPPYAAPNWGVTINGNLSIIDNAIGLLQSPYMGAWSSTAIYSRGQEVSYGGSFYLSSINSNFHNTPGVGSGWSLLPWSGGSMVYPPAGLAASTSSAWRTPLYSDVTALFGGGSCAGFLKSDGTCVSSPGIPYPSAGIAKSTGSAWAIPTFADFVAYWASGSCSGFLKSDGTCSTLTAGVSSLNSLTGALSLTSSDSSVSITPSGSTIDLKASGGGGGNNVQYNDPTTNYYIYSDSRSVVSSSCYVSGTPDAVTISSGSISGGVLTATTGTNYYALPDAVTLSGFTGGASALNGQVVTLTTATSSSITGPVTGITTLASTGTGAVACTYNLSGQLRSEPFINGHGTVINGSIPALTSAAAITDYSTTAHLRSPAVTGHAGFLIIQVGGQDWLNSGWSLSTTEANISSLLSTARADNWTAIILTTVIPHNASLYNNPVPDILSLNAWIRAQIKSQANVATGQYADWIEDSAQLFPNGADATYIMQSGTESGHLDDAGARKWADDINANFANQASALAPTPNCGPWSDVPCLNESNTFGSTQTFNNVTVNGTCAGCTQGQYKTWSCQPGLGDGTNAIAAATYHQVECYNTTGATWSITGIKCYVDGGSSTMNVTNGSGTGLLTGAVTCSTSFAAGTQSGTTTIANGDYLKFTFVADGTATQTAWVINGTY